MNNIAGSFIEILFLKKQFIITVPAPYPVHIIMSVKTTAGVKTRSLHVCSVKKGKAIIDEPKSFCYNNIIKK